MPLFYAITVAFLGFLLFALFEPMQFTYAAWLPGYEVADHRVHHVMIGTMLLLLSVSIAAQLFRPAKRVGAYLLAAVLIGSIAVATVVGEGVAALSELAIFIVPVAVLGLLHPGLRSFRLARERVDTRMFALAAVAAVPLFAFAALQLNLHLTLVDEHVAFEHYIMMAGGTVTIGLGALLASFRPVGWRFLAYSIAIMMVMVATASMVFTDAVQGTNFGVAGGALAVLWAVSFVAVAEYDSRLRPGNSEPETTETPA